MRGFRGELEMAVTIAKGILSGLTLRELAPEDLLRLSQSSTQTALTLCSFYKGNIDKLTFRGITFKECSFARVNFSSVTFSRCKFVRVDLTRASFRDCFFSDTPFVDCDPYFASFDHTEIAPSSFRRCFLMHSEWNKALRLFASLRVSLKEMGETRSSRAAEYYFRVWQRRRLFHRWHLKRISGVSAWFWSLCLGAFTGYGERPIYLAAWAFALITALSGVYMKWLPYAVGGQDPSFLGYWYYSFKVFFAQGLSAGFQSISLSVIQVGEFIAGLVMVSLLIGSIVRKLSP